MTNVDFLKTSSRNEIMINKRKNVKMDEDTVCTYVIGIKVGSYLCTEIYNTPTFVRLSSGKSLGILFQKRFSFVPQFIVKIRT